MKFRGNKDKQKKLLYRRIRRVLYPHVILISGVFIIIVVTLVFAFYFEYKGFKFASSLLSSISTGLITGLVLCLISASKDVVLYKYNQQKQWLENMHKMIKEFITLHYSMYRSNEKIANEEEVSEIDDVLICVKKINDTIFYSSEKEHLWFDGYKYSKKYYEYDAVEMDKYIQEVRDKINGITIGTHRKIVIEYFEELFEILFNLNGMVMEDYKEIELRLSILNRSIL